MEPLYSCKHRAIRFSDTAVSFLLLRYEKHSAVAKGGIIVITSLKWSGTFRRELRARITRAFYSNLISVTFASPFHCGAKVWNPRSAWRFFWTLSWKLLNIILRHVTPLHHSPSNRVLYLFHLGLRVIRKSTWSLCQQSFEILSSIRLYTYFKRVKYPF